MENSLFSIHFPSMDLPLLFPSFLPLSDPVRRDPAEALQLWLEWWASQAADLQRWASSAAASDTGDGTARWSCKLVFCRMTHFDTNRQVS
jgi:hypothetical protein